MNAGGIGGGELRGEQAFLGHLGLMVDDSESFKLRLSLDRVGISLNREDHAKRLARLEVRGITLDALVAPRVALATIEVGGLIVEDATPGLPEAERRVVGLQEAAAAGSSGSLLRFRLEACQAPGEQLWHSIITIYGHH